MSLNKLETVSRLPANGGSLIKENSGLLTGIIICMIIAAISSFFYWEKDWYREQRQYEKIMIAQQAELIETTRNNALVNVMNSVVDHVNDELTHHSNRMLSDETIARVASLSYSFKPFSHIEGDSISFRKLSPERGLLLLIISGMKIDSSSLEKLMRQSVFSSANLRNADLHNARLKGVNLQGADLRGANLEGANLNEADLRSADLWGSNLKHASLILADLTSADISWSDLNGSILKGAKLNKGILKSAQLRKADLRGAFLQHADLSGAFLNEANLEGADMLSVMLYRTNLGSANLNNANLTTATLTEANLTGLLVSQKNWLTRLNEWKVTGATEIATLYQLVKDSDTLVPQYRLKKRYK